MDCRAPLAMTGPRGGVPANITIRHPRDGGDPERRISEATPDSRLRGNDGPGKSDRSERSDAREFGASAGSWW